MPLHDYRKWDNFDVGSDDSDASDDEPQLEEKFEEKIEDNEDNTITKPKKTKKPFVMTEKQEKSPSQKLKNKERRTLS